MVTPEHHENQQQHQSLAQVPQQPTKPSVEIDPTEPENLVYSATLQGYSEQRAAGLIPPFLANEGEEWADAWTLSVLPRKAVELKNQYSRVGILIEHNFADFIAAPGAEETFERATLEDLSRAKARILYKASGLPSVAETHDLAIDAPESGSKIHKTLQQGYYTRDVAGEGDVMIDRVRPISDENRATRFCSCVAYFDGEMEIVTHGSAIVAMAFSAARYVTVATAAAFDDLYKMLTRRLGLALYTPEQSRAQLAAGSRNETKKFVGATMLRERLMREGKLLDDGIVKVSSFLNHMVDVDLMEECGLELAERLRSTMPNKILTVESTGLIPGLPTARQLGIPLVFARKSRPITISDSFQTTYRSATKSITSELVVSCEYLQAGDRVLIIDDFLAGGSTAEALFKLAKMAHAKVVGVGVLIEKMSSGGRAFLSGYSVPVESLAKVDVADLATSRPRLIVVEEEPWQNRLKNKASDEENAKPVARKRVQDSNDVIFGDLDIDDDLDDEGVVAIDGDDDDEFDQYDLIEDELKRSVGR